MANIEIHVEKGTTKSNIILISILFLIGCFLIGFGIYLQVKANEWIITDATIVEIGTVRHGSSTALDVFVSYVVDEKNYDHVYLQAYETWMKVEDIIQIKYNPLDPWQIQYARQGYYNILYVGGSFSLFLSFLITFFRFIFPKIRKEKFENGLSN